MRICIHTVRRWAHQTGRKQVCGRCEGVVPSRVLSRLRCLPRLAPGLLPQMVLRQILVLPDTNWQPAVTSPRLASPRHGRRAALLVTRSLHGALRVDATMARGKYLGPPTGTKLSSTVDTRPRRNHHPPWSRRHTHFRDWTHAHGMEWHGKLGSHTARASSPFWGALHYLPTASCPVLLLGLGCCRWDAWSSRAEARPRVPGVDPQPLRALPLLHHHAWKNTTSSLTSPPRPLFVNRSATGRGAEFRQWIVHCLSP